MDRILTAFLNLGRGDRGFEA